MAIILYMEYIAVTFLWYIKEKARCTINSLIYIVSTDHLAYMSRKGSYNNSRANY